MRASRSVVRRVALVTSAQSPFTSSLLRDRLLHFFIIYEIILKVKSQTGVYLFSGDASLSIGTKFAFVFSSHLRDSGVELFPTKQ